MDERDSDPRRIATAMTMGAVVLALVECAYVLVFSAPSFDGFVERATFVGIALSLASIVGATTALLAIGFLRITRELAPVTRRSILVALASPFCAYAGWMSFRGPQAQKIPAHDLLAIVVAIIAMGGIYASLVFTARMLAQRPRALAIVASVVVLALQVLDQRVLPRLYPFFHRGIELAAFGAAVVLALAIGRPRGRISTGGFVALALGGAIVAMLGLSHERSVTTVLVDRAPTAAAIARPLLRLRTQHTASVPVAPMEPQAALPPGPRLGSRDVVLITIDAVRADRLVPSVMPNAVALADHGVRFDEAYTQVPHTSFAIATLLTGKAVYSLSALGLDAESHQTLAQIMRRERYKTAAFFPPAVFFIDHDRLAPLERSAYGFEYVKYEYLDATKRTDQVIDFFEREHPAHAFVWVHYLEPHEPYELQPGHTAGTPGGPPAEPDRPDAQVRYEGEIRAVDAQLGRLVDYLRRARPGALIVLAADHGEEFGEHGGRYHGTTLFDEQVRVPLVFSLVGEKDTALPARRVPGPVGLVDVAPTLLSLLGIPASARMRGHDLSPFMAEKPLQADRGPVFAEIDRKKMVVDGRYKLVCDLEVGTCALYDRQIDPGERRDVSAQQPAIQAKLRATLDHFMSGESRFESHEQIDPTLDKLFERGRLGDATAAPELTAALPTMSTETRHAALRVLAELPPVTAPQRIAESMSEEDTALFDLACARSGDNDAQQRLAKLLKRPPPSWMSTEMQARLALGSANATAMEHSIIAVEDRSLVSALAHSLAKDPNALDALTIALAPVRSREEVARAIGELGDPRAIDRLLRWLPNDPYVPVRVSMVRALDKLAVDPKDRARVRAALSPLVATEMETPVLCALATLLGPGRYGEAKLERAKVPNKHTLDCATPWQLNRKRP